jgi:hypothetical protein
MEFATAYRKHEARLEYNDGPVLVETAGYIPAKMQIEQLINAGRRLEAARAEMYDFGPDDKVDDTVDPRVRRKDYDLAEASEDAQEVSERLRKQELDAKYQKEMEDALEAPEGAPEEDEPAE